MKLINPEDHRITLIGDLEEIAAVDEAYRQAIEDAEIYNQRIIAATIEACAAFLDAVLGGGEAGEIIRAAPDLIAGSVLDGLAGEPAEEGSDDG